ncbi:TPA: acyltransferase family protein [Neisseria meningitidis]|uniref:acyltransferase family protein n=1 Tax=Neisseria TaxID=482 RepID=UPI0002A50B98|nr:MULTISPECIES: acyltransferase [Neisseria]ELK62869.1 putative acetyltransferase PglI [Neisseria meningitidis 68094]ELL26718.1 putative acetyltransferase PglI [Neisseria meningitidis 70030]EOB64729.1 putative acetyltransferase PglI [Neisseria meningitidis 70082]MCL5825848.1 acyltransferase [Neisseria meningitidis]MCL6011670.1 acyltransferase [Neisseria meningitidis]
MSQALPYRPDIDTLRAAAVLSVIVFHIEKNWLPGGFLGVDIFFVISGFLMTEILLREMSGGGGGFP